MKHAVKYLLTLLVLFFGLLLFGGEINSYKIFNLMHTGTLIAWLSIIIVAGISYLVVRQNNSLKKIQTDILILAMLWFPISTIISGNTSLIFPSSKLFLLWIAVTLIIIVFSVFIAVLYSVIKKQKGSK